MSTRLLTPMQHAHAALVLALNKIERDVRVRELTEEEESEIVQAVLRAFFQGFGDLPDPDSHAAGWSAAHIEHRWRVGRKGVFQPAEESILTLNFRGGYQNDKEIAEWLAAVYTTAAGVLGLHELPLTETEKRPTDSVNVRLDSAHKEALRRLSQETEMSESAVMRQALRLYQLNQSRVKAGETLSWSGDAERAAQFAGTEPPRAQPLNGAVHTVLTEMARRKFVRERPGEVWVHVGPAERQRWIELVRDELGSPAPTDPDTQLVRQAYIDGAQAMADCVKSLQLHVTLGPKATFEDGMRVMQDSVHSVVDGNLRSIVGSPPEDPSDG